MIYATITELAGPLLRRHLNLRAAKGKEDAARLDERCGIASRPRPDGKLLWFHAASVGEGVALLALITAITGRYPGLKILVTSGTVTSAEILGRRLPSGAIHQYVPLDKPAWVAAFLDHWHPDAAIWTESEIWPNLLAALAKRGIPAAMVNGRLSAGSARSWRLLAGTFRKLLNGFTVRLAQSEADAARFAALGIPFRHVGNLKLAVESAPIDAKTLEEVRAAIGSRPLWLAASTHPGEEAIAIAVHRELVAKHPGLLTIVVPRHPARGDEIAAAAAGIRIDRRSAGSLPEEQTAIYLADTLGELNVFYELAPIAFVGGSLTFDGHSPIEAAQRDVAIVYGPEMRNNASIAMALETAGGAIRIESVSDLSDVIGGWLENPQAALAIAALAKGVAESGHEVVGRILDELQPVFVAAGIA